MYYQPVIFDTDQTSINGIGLYRNNSISIYSDDDVQASGHYYVPDYLIKIEEKNKIKYFIIDAKFSDITQVRRHYIKDLAFKYLFSISTIDNDDIIKGMGIIYGKCSEDDKLRSVYDNKIGENEIIPMVETLPLIESVSNENQYGKLDNLFMKILE